MKVGLAIAVLALVLPAVAGAQAPAGFTEAAVLEPAASYVAGKPVKVYCGRDLGQIQGSDRSGYTPVVGGDTVYVTEQLCRAMRDWLRGRDVNLADLGIGIETLTHEALHAAGDPDEGRVECAAVRRVAAVAIQWFHVRGHKTLHDLTGYVWLAHRGLPAAYLTVC